MQRLSDVVHRSIKELSEVLYTQCHELENPRPVFVAFIHNEDISMQTLSQYRESQTRSSQRYSMATLITGGSELEIEGKRPRTAVIDSGASSIILGKSFSEHIRRCHRDNLNFGDTFVTARGTIKTCVGSKRNGLAFILAKGT